MLIIKNKLRHWRLVDLDLLDAHLLLERVSHDMYRPRQVRIGYSREEGLVTVHEPELRVLVASFILRA